MDGIIFLSSKKSEALIELLGLKNVPDGKWVVEKGSLAINSNNNSTYIPLVQAQVDWNNGGLKVDGKQAGSASYTGSSGNGWSSKWENTNEHIYHVYLPPLFDNDLSLLQKYSCTASVWVHKVN